MREEPDTPAANDGPHPGLREGARPEARMWAREMRRNPAQGERELWERLRGKRLGFRFRRQARLRYWIADFWCPAKRLVVEVDGGSHRNKQNRIRDWFRDKALAEEFGIETLRFPVERIKADLDGVLDQIIRVIARRPTSYISTNWPGRPPAMQKSNRSTPASESMTPVHALRAFYELLEELEDISGSAEYQSLMLRLLSIKDALASHPERRKVATKIRELQGRLPEIQERESRNREFHVGARIAEVEQSRPRCGNGHAMVIRRRADGRLFWGCSEYPRCRDRKPLTRDEISRLSV